jgi:ankyrin repeat protein
MDVHSKAIQGTTPMMFACLEGHAEVVRVLIKEGREDPDVRSRALLAPLHTAAMNNRLEVTRTLLSLGADPWAVEGNSGRTALDMAVSRGYTELAQLLTEAMERPT